MQKLTEVDADGYTDYIVTLVAQGGVKFEPPFTWQSVEQNLKDHLQIMEDLEYHSTIVPFSEFKKRGSKWNKFAQTNVKGFVALGDSAVSFNPVYGQGISTAAEAVLVLDHTVRTENSKDVAPVFQRRLSDVLTFPWLLSTMNDLQFAESKHSDIARFLSWVGGNVLRKLLKVKAKDDWLLVNFYAAMAMKEGYLQTMMSPEFGFHVLFPQGGSIPCGSLPKNTKD
jgi:2-polyprenyl-6-methoxyphenol hydroxylase-like FAD-dependent oxidoreductase